MFSDLFEVTVNISGISEYSNEFNIPNTIKIIYDKENLKLLFKNKNDIKEDLIERTLFHPALRNIHDNYQEFTYHGENILTDILSGNVWLCVHSGC